MQFCPKLKEIKEWLRWDERFCPDTGKVCEVARSLSVELKDAADAVRWDHHVARTPPDAIKFHLERKWLPSAYRSVPALTAMPDHQQVPIFISLSISCLVFLLWFCFFTWFAISAFLATLTPRFPVLGSGCESDTWIQTLVPSFTSWTTLDKSLNIFYA